MKKIAPILIIGILVLSGFGAVAITNDEKAAASRGDELDQSQTVMTENTLVPVGQILIDENLTNIQVAQSFIPTKDILTRVELFIAKNTTTIYPLIVSIRDNLTKEDLTIASVDPGQVPTQDFGWVEINFSDIMITIGQTYYVVCLTENTTDNLYGWGANNDSESYPFGCAWFSVDDGNSWFNESVSSSSHNVEPYICKAEQTLFDDSVTWDMCFKTYGFINQAPNKPTIDGPINGRVGETLDYVISTTDPDGDQVYYWVSWFDGCPGIYWDGPYNSGEPINKSYTYDKKGTFTISVQAKDIYEAKSDWVTLEVTIPRNRVSYINLIYRMFKLFPNVFLIFRHILGL